MWRQHTQTPGAETDAKKFRTGGTLHGTVPICTPGGSQEGGSGFVTLQGLEVQAIHKGLATTLPPLTEFVGQDLTSLCGSSPKLFPCASVSNGSA